MKANLATVALSLSILLSSCAAGGSTNEQADEACTSLNSLIQDLMMEAVFSYDEFHTRMTDIHSSAMVAETLDQKFEGFGKQIESFESIWSQTYPDALPNAKGTEPLRYTWDTYCGTK